MALSIDTKNLKNWIYSYDKNGFIRKSDNAFVNFNEVSRKPDDKYLEEILKKKEEAFKPSPVRTIKCSNCGEPLIKLYPWNPFGINLPAGTPLCKRCLKNANRNR